MRIIIAVLLLVGTSLAARADNPVQALVDAAIAEGRSQVTLPGGELRLDSAVRVRDARDLVIDGRGTTLIFANWRDSGLDLLGSTRLTVRNLTLDCNPLPFTQGTIVSISEDHATWEFEVHAGYPELTEPYLARQAYVYDPASGRLRRGIPDIYPRGVEALSPTRGRITVNPAIPGHDRVAVGDLIVLNIRDGQGVYMNSCADLRLENITVLACPGIAFIARYVWGENVFRRLTVRPGPTPAGATQPRLMSACADAFNYAYATRGPLVERCRFRAMGDDSVNLHGPTFAVCAVGEGEVVLGRPYGGEPYERMVAPGDAIEGLRVGSFERIGSAPVASIEREREVDDAWRARVQELWPRVEVRTGSFFRVRLTAPLAVEVGDWVTIPATAAPGFVIRDCEFRDHRARGMRIQSSHGVIERNVLRGLQGAGISVGPEFGYWREAGWVEDLVVRDNVIEDVGRGSVAMERWGFPLAGITIFGRVEPEVACPPGNRGIIVGGNTIDGCPAAGIHVSCALEVQVTRNVIAHTNYLAAEEGEPIEVENAEDVTVEGNVLRAIGEAP